ncbi:MAG: hypothetical protein HN496_05960, partial [Flavobacteriaceae bacterium]|nr:hypothetical protein [Flavobacteriaceae bacterium]
MKFFLILLGYLFLITKPLLAENVYVFDFTNDELNTLKVKKVKGETSWAVGSNENGNFIRAEAEGVGSGLGKEIRIDLNK